MSALHVDAPKGTPRGIALVLHGGRSKSTAPTRVTQLAVVRMLPFVSSLRRASADVAVARLRYTVRGWNGPAQSPVADVTGALDTLADRFPGVPIALVGHSMGGRAAVYAAGHPAVSVVVGLAPWIEPGDPDAQLAGRHVLFVHGDHDRMTSADASAAFARQAATVAAAVGYITVRGERHAMLRRAGVWHQLATGYVLAVLCGRPPGETVDAETANLLTRTLAGASSLVA